jgi:DNA gyrase/topoisomerase IV subunit A
MLEEEEKLKTTQEELKRQEAHTEELSASAKLLLEELEKQRAVRRWPFYGPRITSLCSDI